MRLLSVTLFSAASHKCKWDEVQQLTVLCSHIVNIVPDGDFDRMFEATQLWSTDSGLPMKLVLITLCLLIDEIEAAPDYRHDRFADYVKSLEEASGAETTTDEKTKSEKPKTGKRRGRPRKAAEAQPQVPKKAPKGAATAAPARSNTEEKPNQKFPAGTVSATVSIPVPDPVPVAANPPKVMLCGYLEKPFADITKQLLAMETPLKDQRLGTLMAKQTIPLPDGMELVLELINGRPKPGVDVFIRKDGKSLTQLNQAVRKYTERYEITYNGTTYKVLPPGG